MTDKPIGPPNRRFTDFEIFPRNRIGSHADFDNDRYWRFARRLDGPLHIERTWRESLQAHADVAVVAIALLCLLAAIVVAQ